MRIAGRDECLVVHDLRLGETGFDVPVRPVFRRLAHRHPSVLRGGEIGARPFEGLQFQTLRADVAVETGIRTVGMQTVERIDRERQRLQVQLDLLDRVLRRRLIYRGDRKNGLPDVLRLLREDRRIGSGYGRHLIRQQHTHDPRHLHRLGDIDALHQGVWHRAREQTAEHHPVGAEVLRVFRLARDFGHHIGGREILPEELVRHEGDAPAARMTPFR